MNFYTVRIAQKFGNLSGLLLGPRIDEEFNRARDTKHVAVLFTLMKDISIGF